MKKLYFKLSDNADLDDVIFTSFSDVVSHIECDLEGYSEESNDFEYTITPIWLTDEEYDKMYLADI